MLERVSLATGALEKSFVFCDGVASFDGQLYILEPSAWSTPGAPVYDTWADAQCGEPASLAETTIDSRVAIHEGVLYSTWHATDVFNWQVLGDSSSGTVVIDGYDGWILGFDVTDDGRFTFLGDFGIQWHELDGRWIGNLPGVTGSGLACAVQ